VEIVTEAGTTVTRLPSGDSFQASSDSRVLAVIEEPTRGSDRGGTFREVRVVWPGGHLETWKDVPAGAGTITLVERRAVSPRQESPRR
jgi:hypothetical protein